MAAPVVVFRGLAAFEGCAGTVPIVVSGLKQAIDVTQQYGEEIILSEHGADVGWIARNEHAMLNCKIKVVAVSAATLAVFITAVTGTAISDLGQPFAAPLSTCTFSTFPAEAAALNGVWQLQPGCKLTSAVDKVAEFDLVMKRYASADQGTAAALIQPV